MKTKHYSQHASQLKAALKASVSAEDLRALHVRSAARHFLCLFRQIALIALATAMLVQDRWALLWIPGVLIQGFTVFNFTVMLHDQLHHTIFARPRPFLERLLGFAYAIPSGISASQFTRWHLDHHAELGSATGDPKRHHLSPKKNSRWLKLLYMTPALFFIYFRAAAREVATYPVELRRRIAMERWLTIVCQLSLLGALLSIDVGMATRVYIVPVFFIFPVAFTLNRLGQHYWIDPEDPAKWSTLVRDSWFWNFAFLNSNFHLEHHYFPGVPMYRLPALHRLLRGFYEERGMVARSYSELLWGWFVRNEAPHTNWPARV